MRRLRCAALSQVWCRRERPETEKAPWLERLRHALWSPAIAYGLIMLLCVPMLSYYWAQGPAASVERLAEQAPQALPSADAVIDDSRGNLGRESAALGSSVSPQTPGRRDEKSAPKRRSDRDPVSTPEPLQHKSEQASGLWDAAPDEEGAAARDLRQRKRSPAFGLSDSFKSESGPPAVENRVQRSAVMEAASVLPSSKEIAIAFEMTSGRRAPRALSFD